MTWEKLKLVYNIGSIIPCKVKYKDIQRQEVVIDCEGFDGILKLEDISVNVPFGKELFNIIEKDDVFNAVIYDIDDVGNKFLLNTKIFRTNLDDIIPFFRSRSIIDNNRSTHLSIDAKFLKQNRNILDRLRGDLSSNELTFLYELIQNAVDHPNKNFNDVSIQFEVFNNYLLVKHNGALFTENNFESITGILFGEQINETEKNRIGYKGIGFKSVFKFTNNAYIRSGNLSFRFCKEESGSDMPWEVLPIFQMEKDMVSKIPQFDFFNTPVSFAFELIDEQSKVDVIKYLNQLSNNPYLLIFLSNLSQLKIKVPSIHFAENGKFSELPALDLNFTKNKSINDDLSIVKLLLNNESHSEWMIYEKNDIVITDQEVINELKNESNTAVPSKMRNFRSPRITIALPKHKLNNDVINLFTYLPLSNTKSKLPFLVNADFIPDLDRTDLIHNLKYNKEVLNFVGITLVELAQKLVIKNDYFYLNELFPNLDLEYNVSSSVIVNSFVLHLNNAVFNFEGREVRFSEISIDKTGFLENFGINTYKLLIGNENIPISHISDCDKILKFIEKTNPDNILYFSDLRKLLKSQVFINWLKGPQNNLKFIEYLIHNNELYNFLNENIFLAQDGNIYSSNEIYLNLGDDSLALSWLKYEKVIHLTVLSILESNGITLLTYEPISFIKNIICNLLKFQILENIKNNTISLIEFYSYLSKYADNILFPVDDIKSFPIKTQFGTLTNWNEYIIFFNSHQLIKLFNDKAISNEHFCLLDDSWCSDTSKYILGVKLGVLEFNELEPSKNIFHIINHEKISKYYFTEKVPSIESSITLWAFIISVYKNLNDNYKGIISTIISKFPVYTKHGIYRELDTLYLSSEYSNNDALEKLAEQFQNTLIEFVSPEYLNASSIIKNEIYNIFKNSGVKDDTHDYLLYTLLPNLNNITDELLIPLTRLVYENRNSTQIITKVIESNVFKLRTKEGVYLPINECILGTPYIEENLVPNPLQCVQLPNQVSAEYSDIYIKSWADFFQDKLKVPKVLNDYHALNLKLKYVLENINNWFIIDNSVSFWNEIYLIYKSGNQILTTFNLDCLKQIPLQCKNSNGIFFFQPNFIHFSSSYNPIFDFEDIFGLASGIPFLSDIYKFENTPELISFFEMIGVSQLYDQARHATFLNNILAADGYIRPANELYVQELKKYVGFSKVSNKDLSKFVYNGKTLENYLGFKSKLDTVSILDYIESTRTDRLELKFLIGELLNVYNPNILGEKNKMNFFIENHHLLSSAKIYTLVKHLYTIDESIQSGIRENEFIIDPLFNKKEIDLREKYFNYFGIRTLGLNDFNPSFEGEENDVEFTKCVNDRLVFLAFIFDSENYLEAETELKTKFNTWSIKKCKKISLRFAKENIQIVKEDSKTFEIRNNKTFYYNKDWKDPRVNPILVDCLIKDILELRNNRTFVQDILLSTPNEIILDLENKGKIIPQDIKNRFAVPPSPPTRTPPPPPTHTPPPPKDEQPEEDPLSSYSNDEVNYIKSIININYLQDGRIDANTTAKIKTLMAVKINYNNIQIVDGGHVLNAGNDKIIVRSAQKGLLYLDLFHWDLLNQENIILSVYTNNQVRLFTSQQELIDYCKPMNKFGILRMPDEYSLECYNSLHNITDKGKWHYVFIVNANTQSARLYKEAIDYTNPDLHNDVNF